jgi:hypothetical protein
MLTISHLAVYRRTTRPMLATKLVVHSDKPALGRRRIATADAKLTTNNHLRVGDR